MTRRIWLSLGLGLVVASSTAWLLVDSNHRKVTYSSLENPFDTRPNSVVRANFIIDHAERYSLRLVLNKSGSVSEERKEIKCKVQVRVMRSGAVVWEGTLENVELAASSNTDISYGLGWLDLTPGSYELIVINLTDLSYLAPMNPRVSLRVTAAALVSRMAIQGFVTALCGAIGVVGLVILIVAGIAKKKRNV